MCHVRIEKDLWVSFKEHCIRNNIIMARTIQSLIGSYLENVKDTKIEVNVKRGKK